LDGGSRRLPDKAKIYSGMSDNRSDWSGSRSDAIFSCRALSWRHHPPEAPRAGRCAGRDRKLRARARL